MEAQKVTELTIEEEDKEHLHLLEETSEVSWPE